ncbi:MAG: hypothetical protein M5U09_09395 [Gammaproteobacteria bacterium]|nr:hypothetical protein [Gammaproteobacteria bacterium]
MSLTLTALESRYVVAQEIVIESERQHRKLPGVWLLEQSAARAMRWTEAAYPNVLVVLDDMDIVNSRGPDNPREYASTVTRAPVIEDQRANQGEPCTCI